MSDTQRPLIAVVRGGYSGESVISHQSAARMMAALDRRRFDPYFVSITADTWSCECPDGVRQPLDRAGFRGGPGLRPFAMALIAIHGSPGEDGLLQGYLEMLQVPYQTGDVLNMALTSSKYSTTALLRQLDFAVSPSVLLQRGDTAALANVHGLGYPCFVKPDRSGSSLGVSKVKRVEDLSGALEVAFRECPSVMVEAGVIGRELTCGVLTLDGEAMALPVCEIRTSREFFDYEAKYHANDTEELVPAPIPDPSTKLVQQRSVAIYKALNCRGLVRVDHMLTDDALVTIEVNTVPGFSAASIFPKMLNAAGLGVDEVINDLVSVALGR